VADHIVNYDENGSASQSWCVCSCGKKSPRARGPAADNLTALDRWADWHIEQKS